MGLKWAAGRKIAGFAKSGREAVDASCHLDKIATLAVLPRDCIARCYRTADFPSILLDACTAFPISTSTCRKN
jgi:hypothetical protein